MNNTLPAPPIEFDLFLPDLMANETEYEIVVGLEVHAQLQTESKLFCGDSSAFGAAPNMHVSPITLAHPGTLPKMNAKAITYAVKLGLACHCEIETSNYFARKNYFYPDLPKGYQVSQHTTPICKNGWVTINTSTGERSIHLNRIHMEEDAGKSIHDLDEDYTCIDYNRAGTALVEMVTEPDIRSSEEAFAFLTEVRKLVRYLGICDGNMEEGSLRCDANISVRLKGATQLGTKVEIKNLNSIRNVKRAIDHEAQRLIGMLQKGETIVQQTRSFDAGTGTSFATREKEDADDYRYFPEPDLSPFYIDDEMMATIRASIPQLQAARVKQYQEMFGLSVYDATVLTEDRAFAEYFESITRVIPNYKSAANWMLGPVKSWLNENNADIEALPVGPAQLAKLLMLVDEGKLSFSIASSRIFPKLLENPDLSPEQIATENNLLQQSDVSDIQPIIDTVLAKFADKVTQYKKGKKGLLALFVGEVMKQSKGKADPKVTHELLIEKLKT